MLLEQVDIPGLCLLTPDVHEDERGFFMESFRNDWLEKLPGAFPFVQDNHAMSVKSGVLRGLHFQLPPAAQGKLVWATRGAIYDVAVDLRVGSPFYGRWFGTVLSARNFKRLFIPRGFAHGYLVMEDETEVQYKADAYYNRELDAGLAWNDPDIGVAWPRVSPALSDKDMRQPSFNDFKSPFRYQP